MHSHTPIFIVTSARPRLGKTLLARALTEYFIAQRRLVAAFDVNPDEFMLADYLPAYTAAASLRDTRGEVALIDQLIVGDNVAKVIDLGHGQFERFFAVMQQINFLAEANRRKVEPIVLFMADADDRSRHGYTVLHERFADFALVPVLNNAVPRIAQVRDNFPVSRRAGVQLVIPALSPVVRSVVDRPKFSFINYVAKTPDETTELYGWIKRVFMSFRALEIRILEGRMTPQLEHLLSPKETLPERGPETLSVLRTRPAS